nr:phage terminase small subunit P27 family [Klebsiella quasipneumoniae]
MGDELDAVGVLTTLDAKALELLIEAYVEYRHHCDTLDRKVHLCRLQRRRFRRRRAEIRMIKPHPAVMKADAWKRIRAMLSEFGMTPASRSRLVQRPAKPTHWKNFLKAQMMNGNRCRWIPLRRARGIRRYRCWRTGASGVPAVLS